MGNSQASEGDRSSLLPENISWQESGMCVTQRVSHLLKTLQWADCEFLVGKFQEKRRLKAHKLILAMHSPVFEALLITYVNNQTEIIEVNDIDADIFQDVLSYIYDRSITWKNAHHVFEVYYAADKYLITDLKELCIMQSHKYLSENLHVFEIHEYASFYSLKDLEDKSFKIITTNSVGFFNTSHGMTSIKETTWLNILSCQKLNISESDLFSCLIEWGKVKCSKNLEENNGDLREAILFALPKIRFLTFTPQEFGVGPQLSGVLTNDEIAFIFIKLFQPSSSIAIPETMCTETRKRDRI